jgi:catechol 2,3-dioxygenase-like lactoylglutathione lyase family enzyme
MLRVQKFKYVLWVEQMSRAVAFYRDLLGLTVLMESDGWSELGRGDVIIGLHAGGTGADCRTGLSVQVEDLSRAVAELIAGGGSLASGPSANDDEPVRICEVRDPEGNLFMLTELSV